MLGQVALIVLLIASSFAFAAWNGSPYIPGATLTPISNVENGKQNLTISTMEKVAKALGVGISILLK